MGTKKIVMVNPYINDDQKRQISTVAEKYGASVEFFDRHSEAKDAAKTAEIIFGVNPRIVEGAGELKWFCSGSAGIEHYNSNEAFSNGEFLLTNSSGTFGLTIAEHIIMVSLMLMRRYPEYAEIVASRSWTNGLEQRSIFGSRILVLGTGDLGENFATRVRSLEPEWIIGVNRSGDYNSAFDEVHPESELNELLPEADLLVMCLPGTAETKDLLSKDRIALLPETAFIVNVGRGSAIDEDALIEALNTGRLAGAALDVFREEPIPEDSPLWTTPNLLITPHISGQNTLQWTRQRNVDMFCEDIENYFEGRPLKYRADLKRGY